MVNLSVDDQFDNKLCIKCEMLFMGHAAVLGHLGALAFAIKDVKEKQQHLRASTRTHDKTVADTGVHLFEN